MAAGQGFKTFNTGDVLSATDVNGYLMQGVLVFASATARDAAITSPQEGQFAYLKDTNTTTYYTGSAWTNLDTTGMVNPMTTTGDTIYSSSGSTPARLGIGTTGQVLTVSGGVPAWVSPSGGGKVLQVVSATYATSYSRSWGAGIGDTGLTASITPTANTSKILVMVSSPIRIERDGNHPSGNIQIVRDSTSLLAVDSNIEGYDNSIPSGGGTYKLNLYFSYQYLDSPATTSSTTYKMQIDPGYATTIRANYPSATSSIILLEIGA